MDKKSYFGSYLAGIFEACCYINITNKTKRKNYPNFHFCFNKDNKLLAEAIKDRIGHGVIYDKNSTYVYNVINRAGVFKIIELIQPYLRTPKLHKFNEMIEYLNKYKYCNLELATLDTSHLLSNPWLAGYLESNGSFIIKIFEDTKKPHQVYCNFMLSQHKIDRFNQSYEPFMASLAELLKTELIEHKIAKDREKSLLISVTDQYALNILISYFNRFPLFGIKFLSYSNFYYAYEIKYIIEIEKEITDKEILDEFHKLKNESRTQRSNFKIEHLDKLPRPD